MVTWGQVSSQSEARSGWTTDQSEAYKLQAETVKITAVNTQAMAEPDAPSQGWFANIVADLAFTQARWHPALHSL